MVAVISWSASTDDIGVAGYVVWRSSSASGVYESLGTTASLSFDDRTGYPDRSYWYRVAAVDAAGNVSAPSAPVGPVHAAWFENPHGQYAVDSQECALCHSAHAASSSMLFPTFAVSAPRGDSDLCLACHDGTGAPADLLEGNVDSFSLASGHSIEATATSPQLARGCSSCHDPHRAPSTTPMIPKTTVNGVPVSGTGPEWCLACHNDKSSWYGAGYPSTSAPTRLANGYPSAGTFPGATTYRGPSDAHVRIPETTQTTDAGTVVRRQQGDCLYCHAAHRGPNTYDALTATYRPSSPSTLASDQAQGPYAALCLTCHGGAVRSGFATAPVDVKRFVTAGGPRSGHRIVTAGGTLPVGAPLPCYDCHGEHGSRRGNASMLSDALGGSLETSSAAGVRHACLSCHTTADTVRMSWDSTASVYAMVSPTARVEGLSRSGGTLALPDRDGHRVGDPQSCYACHGNSYVAGGHNVHDPDSNGVSQGGQSCYTCHSVFQTYMEDRLAIATGALSSTSYHHVLGNSSADGDTAFASGSYPGAGTDVYCLSCHVDHDKFNANKGANLRMGMTASSEGAATDFNSDGGGVCLGCHDVSLTKDTSALKPGGTAETPALNQASYAASAHNYSVSSQFGRSSNFNANCSKCHSDEQAKDYQTGTNRFGTHYSAWDRLLLFLGFTLPGSVAETDSNPCANCHGGGGSADYFGAASMSATSTSVWGEFLQSGSSHPGGAAAGVHRSDETTGEARHVECEDCHDPHVARPGVHTPQQSGSTAAPVIWGTIGYAPAYPAFSSFDAMHQYGFDTDSQTGQPSAFARITIGALTPEAYLCLRCHSKSIAPSIWPTSVSTKSGTYAPTDVAAEFSPANASGHNVLGSLTAWPRTEFGTVAGAANVTWPLPSSNGSWLKAGWSTSGTASMVQCSDCHTVSGASQAAGPHGSSIKWLLDDDVNGSGTGDYASAYLSSGGMSGNPICAKCHQTGTSFLGATNSVHGQANHQGPTVGKCINCHVRIPHGWMRPRMLAYTSDPAPYASAALRGVRANPATSTVGIVWRESDCNATCHSGSPTPATPVWP